MCVCPGVIPALALCVLEIKQTFAALMGTKRVMDRWMDGWMVLLWQFITGYDSGEDAAAIC